MKRRLGLLLLAMLWLLGGCGRLGERDYFAYRGGDFSGEVRGSMNGVDFCARIDLQRAGEEWAVGVSYFAPEMLEGTEISAVCDGRGEMLGEIEILRGNTRFLADGDAMAGLLRPATVWLSCAELASVQKTGGEYRLLFEGGEMIRMRADGIPILVSGERFSMEMIWMERRMSD